MELEVKYHLFTKLSETILYEYIYPYIYQRQPQDLLNEINQFPSTKFDLYRVYDIPLEQNILYYDLISYMNRRSVSLIQIDKGRENILRRHHMLKDYSANKLLEFYTKYFSVNKMKDVETKCGVLWGLFTQDERIRFINRRMSFLESSL
tara:strand:- start:47 stop:493 length:447 start_codon:yes stop_codon:yes gene_type:complete